MMLLSRISVQLSVEPLIAHAFYNFQDARTITSVVLLRALQNTGGALSYIAR